MARIQILILIALAAVGLAACSAPDKAGSDPLLDNYTFRSIDEIVDTELLVTNFANDGTASLPIESSIPVACTIVYGTTPAAGDGSLRPKAVYLPPGDYPRSGDFYNPADFFFPVRNLELRNIYDIGGRDIDLTTFELTVSTRLGEQREHLEGDPEATYLRMLGVDKEDEFTNPGFDNIIDRAFIYPGTGLIGPIEEDLPRGGDGGVPSPFCRRPSRESRSRFDERLPHGPVIRPVRRGELPDVPPAGFVLGAEILRIRVGHQSHTVGTPARLPPRSDSANVPYPAPDGTK